MLDSQKRINHGHPDIKLTKQLPEFARPIIVNTWHRLFSGLHPHRKMNILNTGRSPCLVHQVPISHGPVPYDIFGAAGPDVSIRLRDYVGLSLP